MENHLALTCEIAHRQDRPSAAQRTPQTGKDDGIDKTHYEELEFKGFHQLM